MPLTLRLLPSTVLPFGLRSPRPCRAPVKITPPATRFLYMRATVDPLFRARRRAGGLLAELRVTVQNGPSTGPNERRLSGEQMHRSLAAFICVMLASSAPSAFGQADPIYLIIRTDDVGMSHSVNMGVQKLIDTGLPLSVSVMFACPWYQEAAAILKRHPEVAVGIHLTLNSEWKYYRWGPVSGREAVPTLVDADGYFFQSAEALYKNHADPREIEKELRAQIERARRSGLKVDYVDFHMGTATRYPEFREVTDRLAPA